MRCSTIFRRAQRSAAIAGAVLALLSAPLAIHAQPTVLNSTHAGPLEAQFRGCEAAGWCRFSIESLDPLAASLHRVRPDGVSWTPCDEAACVAVRDRLNSVLSSMIHQHKHIVLHDLRALDDGTFAAAVTVNGQPLASDPILVELREERNGAIR